MRIVERRNGVIIGIIDSIDSERIRQFKEEMRLRK